MTKKESQRLKQFLKTHLPNCKLSHTFIITYNNDYIGNRDLNKALTDSSYLDTPFRKIKKISLWIDTDKGVYYF